jgi:large subunit ribosomal protein L9
MPNTEILLVEQVDKLGSEGDIVKVRPGYARNFLFPQKKALPLNQANKRRLDALKVARAARESEEIQGAQEIASKLNDVSIAVAVKTGAGGKLFGYVTAPHILEKLDEKGFKLDKKHLVKFSAIKQLGQTKVTCQLHKDISAEINVEVVSENPIEEKE